jgi:hypothetical protein
MVAAAAAGLRMLGQMWLVEQAHRASSLSKSSINQEIQT